MNLPLALTLFRLLTIPFFFLLYLLPYPWAHHSAAVLFVVAAITDWLDGYLARILSQTTRFGAFLDPVADKLLISAVLILLVSKPYIAYLTIPATVIICREITISALREWMAEIGKRASITVNFLSKIKTSIQMIALVLLIWYTPSYLIYSPWILYLGTILLWIAAILTVWTMIIYLKISWPDLTISHE